MPLHSTQIYPLSMDSKRIFCAYHDTQFLTNFCQQKQCLMPLCPSCIAEHTEEHFKEGKKPTYTNLNDALNRAKQSCYCTIITLQQYKKVNHDIFAYISSLQNNIHSQLMAKRNELFEVITQIFRDYQIRLMRQINQNYQEKKVYLVEESINASKFIDEQITNLYQKINMLKGEDCLSSLITYYAVDEHNYRQALEQFDDYFEKNRKAGRLEISMVDETLKKLTDNLCDNLLSVQCIIQNFQPKSQQSDQQQPLKSKRYGFNKNLSPSQTLKNSRQDPYQKQNQQNDNEMKSQLVKSRRNRENIGIIARQQKQASVNNNMRPPLPFIKTNDSISNESISRRKSIADSALLMEQDGKRLTRQFKKQP